MIYRQQVDGRFRLFPVRFCHTDAQLGVAGLTLSDELLKKRLISCLSACYDELDREIGDEPEFATTLEPWPRSGQTAIGRAMVTASKAFKVGPMAAVAGAVAERVRHELRSCCDEVFFENGGDIAVSNRLPLKLSVFAGGPPFDRPILLTLPAGLWGIASSSGVLGHSFSRGEAQMVTIVAKNSTLADAAATAVANQVKPDCNPQKLVQQHFSGIEAILIIYNGALFYRGEFELGFC